MKKVIFAGSVIMSFLMATHGFAESDSYAYSSEDRNNNSVSDLAFNNDDNGVQKFGDKDNSDLSSTNNDDSDNFTSRDGETLGEED